MFVRFREFYYIQMEKYARQALSEGVKSEQDLQIHEDSELYRVLNVHYNRNNHIEVRPIKKRTSRTHSCSGNLISVLGDECFCEEGY